MRKPTEKNRSLRLVVARLREVSEALCLHNTNGHIDGHTETSDTRQVFLSDTKISVHEADTKPAPNGRVANTEETIKQQINTLRVDAETQAIKNMVEAARRRREFIANKTDETKDHTT